MRRISALALFFLISFGCAAASPSEKNDLSDDSLIGSWRSEKVVLEDIDLHYCRVHIVSQQDCERGFRLTATKRWMDFISRYKQGDEIWFFMSPAHTWEALMGRQGYAIFRGDKLVDHITTLLN